MNTTIRKIGNSEGVILPKEMLDRLNLKAGDSFRSSRPDKELALRATDDSFRAADGAQLEVMDKYKVALQKLAE